MDALLFLKPILTALLLPAASGPGLILLLSVWALLSDRTVQQRVMAGITGGVALALWWVSCPAVAVWLSVHLLPAVQPLKLQDLKSQQVQAVVVLGGGVENHTPEYDGPNLASASLSRLLYGLQISRSAQLPMAFSGGQGWAATGEAPSEADVADQVLARLQAPPLRWRENRSRDTRENARMTFDMLQADGIRRIALVTHAWHMPRSVRNFEQAGFAVVPAPMGYIQTHERPILQWIPSAQGLKDSSAVLKEWLGWRLT